jgi:lipopolysaccharide export system protein LptA
MTRKMAHVSGAGRCGFLAACLLLAAASFAAAQNTGVPNALQGFSQNKDQPVHIEAATLEVRDKDKRATFSGNVIVKQGDTTLRSKTLDVFYDQDDAAKGGMKAAQPGPGGKQSIRRLEAKGGVTVTQKEQTATGQTGIFDMKSNTITMTGGVVISQGKNVLKGDRLIVDVATGHAKMEAGQGRVSGMFSPSSKDEAGKEDKKSDTPAARTKKPAKGGTTGGSAARP